MAAGDERRGLRARQVEATGDQQVEPLAVASSSVNVCRSPLPAAHQLGGDGVTGDLSGGVHCEWRSRSSRHSTMRQQHGAATHPMSATLNVQNRQLLHADVNKIHYPAC